MRILADFHHQALYHSLYLLFEKRLGWELYRPIGPEWHEQGYWHVYEHPSTVVQFLGLHQGTESPIDIHGQPLTDHVQVNKHYVEEDGIYYIQDMTYGTTARAVRLDKFREMDFDILISSIPQHIAPYNKLIAECQPHAKHIFQVGNRWTNLPGVQNIMASTAKFHTDAHAIFYHQEFDLNIFKYKPPIEHNTIYSYIHYMKEPQRLKQLGQLLPGWQTITYGGGMDDVLNGQEAVAEAMSRGAFAWHFKPGGDGFGHSLYGIYACGRPALIYRPHYTGCGANDLFIDEVTCLDTSKYQPYELAEKLKYFSQPEEHEKMCVAAKNRFDEVVNYDNEFELLKGFLQNLR